MNINIVCGKHDNKIDFIPIKNRKRIRIGSRNPKYIKNTDFIPISTDGLYIYFNYEKILVRKFLENFQYKKYVKLILLTKKEKDLILSELLDFNIKVVIFEKIYPIFNLKYISNLEKTYLKLLALLEEMNTLELKGKSLTKYLSTKYLYKIERKLRYKNNLDKFFYFAYKGGYQEVFKLKEERENRVIIAMDFNSMFIDSMNDKFVKPKNVIYKNYKDEKININDLNHGLYKVILKNPKNTFFKKFHPFKYIRLFKSFYFNLDKNHHIETLLFKNEIDYYKKFFNDILIIEGFFSKETMKHPLSDYAEEIYQKRLKYRLDGNNVMERLMKLKLITIHSSTNPKKFQYFKFNSQKKLIEYITEKYMLNLPTIDRDNEMEYIDDQKLLTIDKIKDTYISKLTQYDSNESIYGLSAQIISNSRLKMIKTIEIFLQYKSIEICYCNIDSIHLSIEKKEVDNFLQKFNNMFSNKIGDLKIESISERGYWFDIGRYWLISGNEVQKFKNRVFNYKGNNKTFLRSRKLRVVHKDKLFTYVKDINKNLIHSFSYNKKISSIHIDNANYSRYNFEEIKNLNVANQTINNEILETKKYKIDLFNDLATV